MNTKTTNHISYEWMVARAGTKLVSNIIRYLWSVLVPSFRPTSVFGFAIILNMISQFLSGFLLAIYYIPDPSLVMVYREEYMNEIWWFWYVYKLHVVGVDSIFILSYIHICQKIFIKNFAGSDADGWTSGTYAFIIYHAVVFLGITLSANHLGDLTLTIGSNIFWSLFLFKHKAYVILFTNRHLNTEELTRLMVAHYLVAWYYLYTVQTHVMNIHERWVTNTKATPTSQDGNNPKGGWFADAVQRESAIMIIVYIVSMSLNIYMNHVAKRPVEFTYFEQWGEAEMEDMNFYIVGPHWYFRPHMGLLTICAQHYEGLFWLAAYYAILATMPLLSRIANPGRSAYKELPEFMSMTESYLQPLLYILFVGSMLYVGGTLPCARFYYEGEEGFFGNIWLRLSYQYIYAYLLVIVHWMDKVERGITIVSQYINTRHYRYASTWR